jgi:hypothetical protein
MNEIKGFEVIGRHLRLPIFFFWLILSGNFADF